MAHLRQNHRTFIKVHVEIGGKDCIVCPREAVFIDDICGHGCIRILQIDRLPSLLGLLKSTTKFIDDALDDWRILADGSLGEVGV